MVVVVFTTGTSAGAATGATDCMGALFAGVLLTAGELLTAGGKVADCAAACGGSGDGNSLADTACLGVECHIPFS